MEMPISRTAPLHSEFKKKYLLRVEYVDSENWVDFHLSNLDEVANTDLNLRVPKIERAYVYQRLSDDFRSETGFRGSVSEAKPHYEGILRKFQTPFYRLRVKSKNSESSNN